MMVEVGDSKQGSKKYIHTQSEVSIYVESKILWTEAKFVDQQQHRGQVED